MLIRGKVGHHHSRFHNYKIRFFDHVLFLGFAWGTPKNKPFSYIDFPSTVDFLVGAFREKNNHHQQIQQSSIINLWKDGLPLCDFCGWTLNGFLVYADHHVLETCSNAKTKSTISCWSILLSWSKKTQVPFARDEKLYSSLHHSPYLTMKHSPKLSFTTPAIKRVNTNSPIYRHHFPSYKSPFSARIWLSTTTIARYSAVGDDHPSDIATFGR